MEVYLKAEYAKSNRSSCATCEQKIQKDHFRVGIVEDQAGYRSRFHSERFYHVKCLPQLPANILFQDQTNIQGFQALNESDQIQLLDVIETQQKNQPQEYENNKQKKSPPKQRQPAVKKKQKLNEEEKSENKIDKSMTKSKQWNNLPTSEEDEDSIREKLIQDMNKSESFDYDDESDDDEENELDLAGYNAEEIKRYRELLIELEKKNVPTLKSILKNNDYYFFGNKDDLISLVADGMILGQIPYCPQCKNGKLKYNIKNGKYICPGYMDVDEFKHCNATFNKNEIKRTEWKT